jgi:transcriptional regulator of aromatic amino acid metabolism
MSRRARGVLDDEDDDSSKATSLELNPLNAPDAAARPADRTLRVNTGYRMAASVEGFALTAGKKRVTVRDGLASIGSAEGNTLVITDDMASRFHCDVRIEDQRALVRDLGSTNGTFINGVRVKEGYLKPGSVLTLGRTEVTFEREGERHFINVSDQPMFGELVGPSASMRRVFGVLEKAARTDSTVILEGETGTGKTRAAAALHGSPSSPMRKRRSSRRSA